MKKEILAAALLLSASSLALAQNSTATGAGSNTGTMQGQSGQGAGTNGGMTDRNTSMEPTQPGRSTYQGGPNNSTGNMNTKGTGPGTTVTGNAGGSGHR